MKKQVGNSIRMEWTILRNGQAEDFSLAQDIKIVAFIPNLSSDKIDVPISRLNNVFHIDIEGDLLSIGKYTLHLTYKVPNPAFESGFEMVSTAVKDAFQILTLGSLEGSLEDNINITSNVIYCLDGATFIPTLTESATEVVISWTNNRGLPNPDPVNIRGTDGKSAFEIWKEFIGQPTATEQDFFDYLQEPAIVAADLATAAANLANSAASAANTAALAANDAADDANAAATSATSAASAANSAASSANTAASNANSAATAATTAATNAQNVADTYATTLANKIDKTAVKQVTGTSTTDVMSQKAVTDELDLLRTWKLLSASVTSVSGVALKYYCFDVKAGDVVSITTSDAANWGVYAKVTQDGGISFIETVATIWGAVSNLKKTIANTGKLYITIASENVTNVKVDIHLSNNAYKFENYPASDIKYDNSVSGLEATNVNEAIDEIAEITNLSKESIGHIVLEESNYTWGPGSANQVICDVLPQNRYKVRVTATTTNTYAVARYNSSFEGGTYDVFSDQEWHEIPMLSNTTRLVLAASGSEQVATKIEIRSIGVEEFSTKYTLPIHTYSVRKSGGADYTSLLECILEATKYTNSIINVQPGDYDLITEFEAYYGANFFTDYTAASIRGIILNKDIHLIFAVGATVTFNYLGDNQYVHSVFSPFNSQEGGGFTLENINLSAKNCRYCVHDERDSTTDAYHNSYINCNMYMDNSANPDWSSKQCIGGGLGVDGYIEVIGCVFETVSETNEAVVSYHNCGSSATAKSKLSIRNNYIKRNGTFALLWVGATTKITSAYVSGNSFGSAIIHQSGGGTVENTEVVGWNNEIRV